MKKVISLSILVFVLAFSARPLTVMGADQPFDVSKAIAAGDHQGLADYYKAQAEKFKKKAMEHETMMEDYKKTHAYKKGAETSFQAHCGKLKADATAMAEKYDAMAKEEEALIKKKK